MSLETRYTRKVTLKTVIPNGVYINELERFIAELKEQEFAGNFVVEVKVSNSGMVSFSAERELVPERKVIPSTRLVGHE